ncbi:MAG: methylenetetrahydrofolate reductase [NAD(P)H] [Bacteroidetes bacterium 47-18]|nr:MAG: methylenetetrahydrofolate reductase [NAD(P)H] [Bacteroidetes bacterium 47-18]
MKITEQIAQATRTLISFEVLPPVRGTNISSLYSQLDPLMEFNPSCINVTYHRAEKTFKHLPDGSYKSIEVRKRPGTVGICAAVMNKYKVDAVPHLICGGFTREETENALIDLHYLGVDNVLALRGDAPKNERFFTPEEKGNRNAYELVQQVSNLNKGHYLEEETLNESTTNFCIGVAGYPEKHCEAANMDLDLHYLKQKVDAGAGYITTQMFFDNKKYFDFVDKCREVGITVPIIPGLKPITTLSQLQVLPSIFNIDIPGELTRSLLQCRSKEDVGIVGKEWLVMQCRELMQAKVPFLHFYTMGKNLVVRDVLKTIL